MAASEIAALPAVKTKLLEAQTQLQNYRQALQQKYGSTLKLRTFAIIAIGMEWLIWEEVIN